jgi:hypothetical protein
MADDILGLGKATEVITKELATLVSPLLRPGAEVAGQMIADQMNSWRLARAVPILKKTKKLLEDNSIEPKAVPLKILVPILNHCSLEEDDDLASKWAGLLASAAAGDEVHPSYPKILSELASVEARMLDALYQRFMESTSDEQDLCTVKELNDKVELSPEQFTVVVVNLKRLELCDVPAHTGGDPLLYTDFSREIPNHFKIRLTSLGTDFVKACCGPQVSVIQPQFP